MNKLKSIKNYIIEKLVINKNIKINKYNYHPKDRKELLELVQKLIKERGDYADLNDIDTSKITDMNYLFINSNFNGDISNWDVSNVTNMYGMFAGSDFNGDISKWDVNRVKSMTMMFKGSKFNGDISNWDVHNDIGMVFMFKNCPLEKNPPKWYKN